MERLNERAQAMVWAALFLSLAALFVLALLDYGTGTARVQETIIAADLAAHAGVQEVAVTADGRVVIKRGAAQVATAYFQANKPAHAELTAVFCGMAGRVPVCRVTAMTRVGGKYLPERAVRVTAVAYLPYGATREGQ